MLNIVMHNGNEVLICAVIIVGVSIFDNVKSSSMWSRFLHLQAYSASANVFYTFVCELLVFICNICTYVDLT